MPGKNFPPNNLIRVICTPVRGIREKCKGGKKGYRAHLRILAFLQKIVKLCFEVLLAFLLA